MIFINKNKAFTLVELLIVLGIISILILIAFPVGDVILQQSRDTGRRAMLAKLGDVLEAYFLEEKVFPPTKGCFNKANFPELESYLMNKEYPLDPLPDNEIQIGGSGVCGGKNEFYYMPLTKGGNPNRSFLLIADTERDKINEEGYISSAAGSTLASFYAAGSGAQEDILNEIKSGTALTGKDNVYVVMR